MKDQKVSYKQLKERLNWSLVQKVDHSLYIIDSFIGQFPNCVTTFSGGLDSLVLLFLVRMIDKDRKAIYVNTTNEFREIVDFVKTKDNVEILFPKMNFKTVLEKIGFPLVSKEQARAIWEAKHTKSEKMRELRLGNSRYAISKKWRFLIDQPFDISHRCCDILKKNPMSPFKNCGVLIGTKASDSSLRKVQYLQNGCINIHSKSATPLSIWTREDVMKFIRQYHIPYCSIYDKGEKTTGCVYCGFGCQYDMTRFHRAELREPKRYKVIMSIRNHGITYYEAIRIVNGRTEKGMFDYIKNDYN